MDCSIKSENGYDLLSVSGEVDLQYSPQLREKILASLKAGNPLLIDLAGVSYIDSSGIGELVSAFTTVRNQGGDLKLLNLTKRIQDLLAITKLLTVFETYEDESEAVKSFGN